MLIYLQIVAVLTFRLPLRLARQRSFSVFVHCRLVKLHRD